MINTYLRITLRLLLNYD